MRTWLYRMLAACGGLLCFGLPALGEVSVTKSGPTRCVLENQFLQVTVDAAAGGRVVSCVHKRTGGPLTYTASATQAPGGSGLALDRFWGDRQLRGFEKTPYTLDVAPVAGGKGTVTVTGELSGLRVRKRFFLQENVSSLFVDYAITNEGDAAYTGRFWVANGLFPGGKPEEIRMFFPFGEWCSDQRVQVGQPQISVLTYRPGESPAESNNFINKPARAWAAVSAGDGLGGAFETDFAFLHRFYSYHPRPGSGSAIPTLEWWTRPLHLPPMKEGHEQAAAHPELEDPLQGYTFHTGWRFTPFAGLLHVSGASSGVVCALTPDAAGLSVQLYSDHADSVSIELSRTQLGVPGEPEPLDVRKLDLAPDRLEAYHLPIAHRAQGTYVYRLRVVRADGSLLAEFEAPYVNGESSGDYSLPPLGPKDTRFDPALDVAPLGAAFEDTCIPWATPLARKLRLLYLNPIRAHLEAGELMRRLDADLSLVETAHLHVFKFSRSAYASWAPPDPEALLREKLKKPHDVILIGASHYWDVIPEELSAEILTQVAAGTGLVYINPKRPSGQLADTLKGPHAPLPEFLLHGVPAAGVLGMERFKPLSTIGHIYEHGAGRIVVLRYSTVPNGKVWRGSRSVTPAIDDDRATQFPYWEYYFSLVNKALLFAAQREPSLEIHSATLTPEGDLALRVTNHGDAGPATVSIQTLGPEGGPEAAVQHKVDVAPGEQELVMQLDLHPTGNGHRFVNGRILREGAVEDWFCCTHETSHEIALSVPVLDKTRQEAGQTVQGTVHVEVNGQPPIPGELVLGVWDMHGRLLGRQQTPAPTASTDVSFSVPLDTPTTSTLCELRAELLRDSRVIDRQRATFAVERSLGNDITFTVWGLSEANHWTKRPVARRMREIGFDVDTGLHISATKKAEYLAAARNAMAAGLEASPMGIFRLATWAGDLKSPIRKPCLTNPEFQAELVDAVKRHVEWASKLCPPYYFVADENSLGHYSSPHDFCQSPTCLAAFREAMRKRYANLESLNQAWKRDYATWNDVAPDTFDTAKARDCFVSWIEHRRFMFTVFTDAMALEKRCVSDVDETGRLAVSGMGMPSVHNGFDWYGMSQHLDHIVAYLRPFLADAMRSFARPGMTLSAWNGYGASYAGLRQRVWHQVLNGFSHPSYWYHRYMIRHGDATLSPAGLEFQSIIREVKSSGLGALIKGAKWHPSPVGIHYSTASLIAAHATGTKTPVGDTVFEANLNGWAQLLRDLGVQPPRAFSTEQILAGELDATAVRIFVLPLSQALTDGEVGALVRFVDEGGILVADGRPGTMHESGVFRERNPLCDLFGVTFSDGPFERPGSTIAMNAPGEEWSCPLAPLEAGLRVATDTVLGSSPGVPATKQVVFGGLAIRSKPGSVSVPSFIVKRHGRGAAVYLNALVDEYGDMRLRGDDVRPVVRAVKSALTAAGFVPDWDASLPPGTEFIRYDSGANNYVGLCRIPGTSKEHGQFHIALPRERHIVDLTGDHTTSSSAVLAGRLAPGETRLFALLPAAPGPLNVKVSRQPQGLKVEVRLSNPSGTPRAGAVSIRILTPEGQEHPAYTANLSIPEGHARVPIALGLNERTGTWQVVVRDVVTGKEATREIALGKRL